MQIIELKVDVLIPYVNNPRKNNVAVDKVAASIKEFGFKVPIVVDRDNVVVCGHTRLKAAKKLGIETVPCLIADDLTEDQIKAFRLADNKVSEFAEWDFEALKAELDNIDIDMSEFGFDFEELKNEGETESKYTQKITVPTYEIKGEKPTYKEMINTDKADELISLIKSKGFDSELEDFLIKTASRLYEFRYDNIAEFYAHQDKDVQEVMEKLALVIIDFNDAVKNGYIKLNKFIENVFLQENNIDE